MSEIHQFKCDSCKQKVSATFNGEHFLPPRNWVELTDVHSVRSIGEHLCPDCLPKTPQNKSKRTK